MLLSGPRSPSVLREREMQRECEAETHEEKEGKGEGLVDEVPEVASSPSGDVLFRVPVLSRTSKEAPGPRADGQFGEGAFWAGGAPASTKGRESSPCVICRLQLGEGSLEHSPLRQCPGSPKARGSSGRTPLRALLSGTNLGGHLPRMPHIAWGIGRHGWVDGGRVSE